MPRPNLLNSDTAAVGDDPTLLAKVIDAVHDAGTRLLAVYSPDARPTAWNEIGRAGHRNKDASLDGLRAALEAVALRHSEWTTTCLC